jgi:hypothetical protein
LDMDVVAEGFDAEGAPNDQIGPVLTQSHSRD